MSYAPYPRGTLLLPSGPVISGNHLFIILNNASEDGFHVLLSICSIREGQDHDATCEFAGGEHEFIKKPSYVFYKRPEQRTVSSIVKCVEAKTYIPKADLAQEHFDRVCIGIEASPFTRPWMENICRATGVI